MRVDLIQIGNSKGIRIPAAILSGLSGDGFELTLDKGRIILEPVDKPRAVWADAFKKNSADSDELVPDVMDEDIDGWEW